MWNIFSNEDLSLHVESENIENNISTEKAVESENKQNILMKTDTHRSCIYENNIKEIRRNIRKKYRIVQTQLLKLAKIAKQFPEIEDEENVNSNKNTKSVGKNCEEDNVTKKEGDINHPDIENSNINLEKNKSNELKQTNNEDNKTIMVSIELIKRMQKITKKIDIEKLSSKKKKKKIYIYKDEDEAFKNNLLKSNLPANYFNASSKNIDIEKSNKKIMRRRSKRLDFLKNGSNNFKNGNIRNIYEHARLLYKNDTKNHNTNHYYNYMSPYDRLKKTKTSIYNDTDNAQLTDFYVTSASNTTFNKLNYMKKNSKINHLNTIIHNDEINYNRIMSNDYSRGYSNDPSVVYGGILNSGSFIQRKGNDKMGYGIFEKKIKNNYKIGLYKYNFNNVMTNYFPEYVGNMEDNLYHLSSQMISIDKKLKRKKKHNFFNKKKVNKFIKDEKIRDLLRTAQNEEDLLEAITSAENAGLHFEAKLGNKKLSKLKVEA
ncbi:conserved Plasmodium protein, unknown function [Plasmodium berghei]|uniref:Uncharacterized protein n=2 Tax=Plasmodium berghei TaxID=5821 RepID=A0A509AFQ4_PLABA|nr:conserved Plasmodium protein, unknown function [Plasmodium berghei ANKA]CXI23376.1 conserved Plasmodium protein, unknown function [Plasmodium berghei]SCM20193.1 conserved Plasmodium protein, unknown function [Plasmodium berghei]SCN23818.1 conserved Plasmodium protein, unknown function [Plasmodium berghei]SCO59255.1 conserved Plasmodium protein, unknown function [Plasmodium berghei]SCO60211.1 conserved Plasmodium protein, unknown function [Plasmodium berghei]|eukprot:XP_034420793.1 conserved Plasmodium protein, unknown function [Plasmodium berghei ANKA]